MDDLATLIDEMLADPRHGWSIGTFGAVGEFARDEDEPAFAGQRGETRRVVTGRGGIAVRPVPGLSAIAYETLSSDGETWGQSVAFCLPAPAHMDQAGVRYLGEDAAALRDEDRGAGLFDLGVGRGHVQFCVRTRDAGLIGALAGMEGDSLFGPAGAAVMGEVLRAQPHRILLSPVGRVEIYSPVPAADGSSPEGPHTHLLPKMVMSGRTHAANAPIPDGLQPVLMLHPRSPWRDGLGRRVPFDRGLDRMFETIADRFGLEQDRLVRRNVEQAVAGDGTPESFAWPDTRRGRAVGRITLRRLARTHDPRVEAWRRLYDRLPEPADDEAVPV